MVLLTLSTRQFLISDLNAELLFKFHQGFFQHSEPLLELLTLLSEDKWTDPRCNHLILWQIEQGSVLPGLFVQLLLLEKAVFDLLFDHVEIIAKSSQIGLKLDVTHVFDAPVDASPRTHDFKELQVRLLLGVLVDSAAEAFHSLLMEGEFFAKYLALNSHFLPFVF